jgi:hypothetical protein
MMLRISFQAFALTICMSCWLPQELLAAPSDQESPTSGPAYLTSDDFDIDGLPQQQYSLDADFENGELKRIDFAGSVGFIVTPSGKVNPEQPWVWIVPLWLALPSHHGDYLARYYVEGLLAQGIYVVGFDVGTSLGSPKGAALFAQFHDHIVQKYKLAPKARMLAVSNGGLITYGYAFRHPERIDRIFAIYPALDFRSWPKFELVVGPTSIAPKGLAYGLNADEMTRRISEFNPIDNLKPLAEARIPLFHIHGDADEIVPLDPNSKLAASRYREMGGDIRLNVLKGGGHGGMKAFTDREALEFLIAPATKTSSE